MVTEMITVKLERQFLNEIDDVVKKGAYQNRTELIRSSLREKVDEVKMREAMIEISKLRGKATRKTTEEEYERNREKAFWEIYNSLK